MNPAELGGILSSTEPLSTVDFSKAKFILEPGWAVGIEDALGTDTVAATVKAGAGEFLLTKDALLQATSLIGLTQNYVLKTPSNLIQPHLNYWYGDGMTKECKLLTQDLTAIAVTKANIYRVRRGRALAETHDVQGVHSRRRDVEFRRSARQLSSWL
jgi:hypothetical protein